MSINDEPVEAIELGIDGDEQELGIVAGRLITWARAVIYIFVLDDGRNAVGFAMARSVREHDLDWARIFARRRALAKANEFVANRGKSHTGRG